MSAVPIQTNGAGQGTLSRPPKALDFEVRGDGIAVLTLDDPLAEVNTLTRPVARDLLALVERVEADPAIQGAVIVSGKRDFLLGANLEQLRSVKLATDAEAMARSFARGLERLAGLSTPFVAAVHGAALGGGFELALACHWIVASHDPRTGFGLPEVRLGLLPAANGMLRVCDRAGLRVALDLSLTGERVPSARARALGLVDEVCPAEKLLDVACARARELARHPASPRRPARNLKALLLEDYVLGRALLFKQARARARAQTRGHAPATERILDVLERYGSRTPRSFAAAADLEAKSFGELVVSETAHRLIELFFATSALKKDNGTGDPSVQPRPVEHVGVLGGGRMGGGVALVTVQAGVPVRLKDRDDGGVGRGLRAVRDALDARARDKRIAPEERDQIFARLSGGTDYAGLKHADVVVEAVYEDLGLKQRVLSDVESVTRDDCVFASTTSSLPIASIAEASRHPETVVGMHYFLPVADAPLVEVVVTDRTAPWVTATVVALGRRQGKTVIVVRDGVGFYTSRILAPYLNEAAHLVVAGVPVDAVDRALVAWGQRVGPLRFVDEVGIDAAARVGARIHAAFGDRLMPPPALKKLTHDDRKGQSNARGFYRYRPGQRSGAVDPSVYAVLGVEPRATLPAEEIQMRCMLAMVNEALRCFGEGIVRSARDGDVGAVLGAGFPPFRGGPFRYVDTLGAAEVLRRVRGYEMRFGPRFAPAPVLVEMARRGGRFYD